jgi:hypothetical protein
MMVVVGFSFGFGSRYTGGVALGRSYLFPVCLNLQMPSWCLCIASSNIWRIDYGKHYFAIYFTLITNYEHSQADFETRSASWFVSTKAIGTIRYPPDLKYLVIGIFFRYYFIKAEIYQLICRIQMFRFQSFHM